MMKRKASIYGKAFHCLISPTAHYLDRKVCLSILLSVFSFLSSLIPVSYPLTFFLLHSFLSFLLPFTRVGTLIVATIYSQLIENRYMFRSFTVLQCSHQHCVQPVASDVEVVGYL